MCLDDGETLRGETNDTTSVFVAYSLHCTILCAITASALWTTTSNSDMPTRLWYVLLGSLDFRPSAYSPFHLYFTVIVLCNQAKNSSMVGNVSKTKVSMRSGYALHSVHCHLVCIEP